MSSKIISASEAVEISHDAMIEKFNELVIRALSKCNQHFYILRPSFGGEFTDAFLNEVRDQGYVLNYGCRIIGVFWGEEAELEEKNDEIKN